LELARSVVTRTKSKIACFAAPSFHEGSGLPGVTVCADAEKGNIAPQIVGIIAKAESIVRRLNPERLGDMVGSFSTLATGCPSRATGVLVFPERDV
jgi:hypothetical protein